MQAAYSGPADGFDATAARQLHPDADLVAGDTPVAAMRMAEAGAVDVAVVPFEDTRAGVATEVVDHLVFGSTELVVVGETDVVVERDGDDPVTVRRFLAVGTSPAADVSRPQTLLFVVPGFNRPGTLSELLAAFSSRGINLTTLQSRPLGAALGMYGFLIEFEGAPMDPLVRGALADMLAATQSAKYLGTFDEGERRWGQVRGRDLAGRPLTLEDIARFGDGS